MRLRARVAALALVAGALGAAACGRERPFERNPEPGVALALAEERSRVIRDLKYDVSFDIPASRDSAVTGVVRISFALTEAGGPLVLDFRAPAENVRSVRLDGDSVAHRVVPDHIVIPADAFGATTGERVVTVEFESTDAALNRNEEFLYALFVPDRASTAFPVFEQPDLKARFTVRLTVPAAWRALSNGVLLSRDSTENNGSRHVITFAETEPISTYLLSFAAGLLAEESAVRDGRTFTMYHRETDAAKVARNSKAIFDLHATALRWLEEYTGIAYPFGKFDFFAVPAFQFGGMEHPGAIWYRADGLFLDPTATRNQELGRASLIAHETAHMWFGDLVTMRWFNDVWMKEVFANFMAAKIAGPSFPDINLKLRFFQAHHPTAYGVDRTPGANPIRQDLENLREAGSLYGAIIYQKAPIVMQQLETLIGAATLREGLRIYLDRFRFANAAWPELIAILDELTEEDLAAWSRVWVEEAGRPTIATRWTDTSLVIAQTDTSRGLQFSWPQVLLFALGRGGSERPSVELLQARMRSTSIEIAVPRAARPDFILAGADGAGYARFVMDSTEIPVLLARVNGLTDPVHRAVAWQTLYEEMLDGRLAPQKLLDGALGALAVEREELVALQALGLVRGIYWRFLGDSARRSIAPRVEDALWAALERAPTPGRKGAYFGALTSVTLTPAGIARLERIWRKSETPPGLPLAEQQYIALSEALALRGVPGAESILHEQEKRITNPDRVARARYVRAALSPDRAVRDSLFRTFSRVENRRRESWVLDAMGLMNHPLRAAESLPNLRASLDLTEEIQRTGDIFFPLRWLNATLDGHQSAEAAETVQRFLAEHPDYPPRLRGKLLQAADDLFRAARIVNGWER